MKAAKIIPTGRVFNTKKMFQQKKKKELKIKTQKPQLIN